MEARNRKLEDWYERVKRGEIKLPRFQRFEAWDRQRICSLIEVVIRNLPLGITLVLEVGDVEKFISRYLQTAPETHNRVSEHLLDGQQRLTALWRAFHNNYEVETYFVYLKEFDRYYEGLDRDDRTVFCRSRYLKHDERYPLWCDDPAASLERGMIPTDLLRPEDIHGELEDWIDRATKPLDPGEDASQLRKFYEFKQQVRDQIVKLRATVAAYNLPYLSLPAQTDKTTALTVFINMNTNSKPLSQYDIIVAEVESLMEQSIHDLEADLNRRFPEIKRHSPLADQILTVSALLQGHLPNQKGAWDMDKRRMVDNWETMSQSLHRMAGFLKSEGISDRERLPTNAVLAVIAALYAHIPESGDKRGQDELLLKRYLWYAFFTDRYENAAASRAFVDFNGLKRIITGEKKQDGTPYGIDDVQIFADHHLADVEELMNADWPKRTTIRGRGILAVATRLGALDFSTGERLDASNIEQRHYHHVYPDALLKEAGINSYLALNCALIADTTNIAIGRKDPLQYLTDRYAWTSEEIVRERLWSHLIPIEELANGGYEGLSEEQKNVNLETDFQSFIRRRADLVHRAVDQLIEGRQINVGTIFGD